MHQTRSEVSRKIPLPRKGTKYVVRAKIDPQNSVPVLIALRDMLKLARTLKEVEKMIYQKLLKINGKEVKDYRESIRLFNILEAGKNYRLILNEKGKFAFEEDNSKERLCKVINKTLVKNNRIQFNLHDGSNLITKDKINIEDSLYLDFSGKVKKHVAFDKGCKCFIISGKYAGQKGAVTSMAGRKAEIKLGSNQDTTMDKRRVFVI